MVPDYVPASGSLSSPLTMSLAGVNRMESGVVDKDSRVQRFILSRTKIEYMRCDFGTTRHEEIDVSLVSRKNIFRYL